MRGVSPDRRLRTKEHRVMKPGVRNTKVEGLLDGHFICDF